MLSVAVMLSNLRATGVLSLIRVASRTVKGPVDSKDKGTLVAEKIGKEITHWYRVVVLVSPSWSHQQLGRCYSLLYP